MSAALELLEKSAGEVSAQVRSRAISAVEVTQGALDRIEALNPQLRAFITVMTKQAQAEAAAVDRLIASGRDLPLAGVPIAIKDSFDVAGVPTTAGSKILANSRPTPNRSNACETPAAWWWVRVRFMSLPTASPAGIRITETAATPGTQPEFPAAPAVAMPWRWLPAWC